MIIRLKSMMGVLIVSPSLEGHYVRGVLPSNPQLSYTVRKAQWTLHLELEKSDIGGRP